MATPVTGTIAQRRQKNVKVSKEEVLMILRSYQLHPSKWSDGIEDIRGNVDVLPPGAKELYKNSTLKQLRDRMSTKLNKLMNIPTEQLKDDDIRMEMVKIKALEKRLVSPTHQAPRDNVAEAMSSDHEPDDDNGPIENDDDVPPVAGPSQSPAREEPARRKKSRKRPLGDLIRENHMAYNKFITKEIPKLLRQLGVSSDSDSD